MSGRRALREILNYRIVIPADAAISRNKALLLILGTVILAVITGLWLNSLISGSGKSSYYEYRINQLKEAVRAHPEDRAAVMELAMNLYLNGDTRKAIALAEQVYRKYPDDRDVLLNFGLMLSDRGDDSQAVKLLERLNKLYPGFAADKTNFYLGQSYLAVGSYDKAAASLEKAAQLDPGNPAVYYCLGRSREKLGEAGKALEAYRRAVLLAGEYPEAEQAVKRLSRRWP